MIELTEEQCQQLSASEPVAIDLQTGKEYMLVPKDTYERLKGLLCAGTELDVREGYPLLDEVAGKAGWDDPAMDLYNRFAPRDPS